MFFAAQSADYRSIMDALSLSQAVIEFTPTGNILTANANFCDLMGYALSEIEGKHHSLFCIPEYAASADYKSFWRDLAQGHFKSDEFKRLGKGGKIAWIQATYNPIRDKSGRVTKVIKFATDITAIKSRNDDFQGKIKAIDRAQAVIEFTPTGEILTANENFLTVLGYDLSEIKGRHHRMFCDPAYAATEDYKAFWRDLASGQFQAAEYKRLGKGGREVYIQASYNPIFDETGAVVKVVKFATDRTAAVLRRLRNDALSRDINDDLGGVIGEITEAAGMASNVAGASSDTSGIINSVAAATEELSQSVRDISASMVVTRDNVEGIFKHAENASAFAKNLDASASAMTGIVTLIQDIAGQINLLALNATIESARAGEAGRGFAVVASEVKSLANQAARSTQTISEEITRMQTVTADVVNALGEISGAMTIVMESVTSVAGAIEQQNAATGEISGNMQSAVDAIHRIEDSLIRIDHSFRQVTLASEQVKKNVEVLAA
ncbi:methyl-accepting chemotaxis protein [Asticcacaulis endophyticus]|uniref:Methyl-accepting chemotaxis sensory transducer with Pas/Pac sensor n=1 Tax=Asticcacaulis endophyticus TaxID=1395890 RepID=A0A918PUA0_9CAUL|nr:PAS domain-containing methyl-accepting chemotaxis protein [Asticcacaulis endophyticus]GGZ21433.1 hypothetical protein GCM10011273_02650 [Asticcacaulis endophyticus]